MFEVTLAWAMPVEITTLGAALEAYVELLPSLHTLRLCHRFGVRPDGTEAIPLPAEVFEYIEGYLIENNRDISADKLKSWEAERDCAEGLCTVLEHYSKEELEEMRKTSRKMMMTARPWRRTALRALSPSFMD